MQSNRRLLLGGAQGVPERLQRLVPGERRPRDVPGNGCPSRLETRPRAASPAAGDRNDLRRGINAPARGSAATLGAEIKVSSEHRDVNHIC